MRLLEYLLYELLPQKPRYENIFPVFLSRPATLRVVQAPAVPHRDRAGNLPTLMTQGRPRFEE